MYACNSWGTPMGSICWCLVGFLNGVDMVFYRSNGQDVEPMVVQKYVT